MEFGEYLLKNKLEMSEDTGKVISESYTLSMGDDYDDAIKAIVKAWEKWKDGPMTESSDIDPARKEVLDDIESMLK